MYFGSNHSLIHAMVQVRWKSFGERVTGYGYTVYPGIGGYIYIYIYSSESSPYTDDTKILHQDSPPRNIEKR
jgi:hypothetical protein